MIRNRKQSITEMKRLTPLQYKEAPLLPLTVLLEDVRSAQNVGAIFRTADAFRVEEIVLTGITPRPPHPLIHKTALGAEDAVPFRYAPTALEVIEEYKLKGYEVWCLEQTIHSTPLEECSMEERKVLLVAGNEVHGVSDELVAQSDRAVEIPQFGTKHSLNVSVSVGVALYALLSPLWSNLQK